MANNEHAEALVVGAGPVGMTTALLLAEQGVKAMVIDAAGGTAAHSYACALHSRSLELLDRLGLYKEVFHWGLCIHRIAFYDGARREAEINLSEVDAKYPFIVVLPQNALEWLLVRTLNRRAKIEVHWRHRLSNLQVFENAVVATVDELRTRTGRRVAIQNTTDEQYPFLVGADGHNSTVRRCLGIDYEEAGGAETYATFEFTTDVDVKPETCVVLDETTANVFWPINKRRCRWTFQMASPGPDVGLPDVFPEKERGAARTKEWPQAEQQLKQLVRDRAPWFAPKVKKLNWAKEVRFERRLAQEFSTRRCWLIGDAAHQTSPIGVQSLNVGLWEADELAPVLKSRFCGESSIMESARWNETWRQEWLQLLGLRNLVSVNPSEWVQRRLLRIPPCLPAAGQKLVDMLGQIKGLGNK